MSARRKAVGQDGLAESWAVVGFTLTLLVGPGCPKKTPWTGAGGLKQTLIAHNQWWLGVRDQGASIVGSSEGPPPGLQRAGCLPAVSSQDWERGREMEGGGGCLFLFL